MSVPLYPYKLYMSGSQPEYRWLPGQWIAYFEGRPVTDAKVEWNPVQKEMETLIGELTSQNRAIAKAAFESLATAPDDSIGAVRKVLMNPGTPSVRRKRMVEILGAMVNGQGADTLLEVLGGRSKYVRDAAIEQLIKIKSGAIKTRLAAMRKKSGHAYPWAKKAIQKALDGMP